MQTPQKLNLGHGLQNKRKQDNDNGDGASTKRRAQPDLQQYHELVNILVGPDEHLFQIHKDKLCSKSRYFSAALKNDWIEARRQQVRLPDIKTESFQHYFNWVYSQRINNEPAVYTTADHAVKTHIEYIDMYAMGQYLQDMAYCNKVINGLIAFCCASGNALGSAVCQHIWDKTAPGSKLRQLVVDMLVWRADPAWFTEDMGVWPQEMVYEMFKLLLHDPKRELKDRTVLLQKKSQYHEETDGAERNKPKLNART